MGVPTSGGESFLKLVMLLLVHTGMTVWVGVSPMSVGPFHVLSWAWQVVNGEEVSVNEADYLSRNLLATEPSRRWRGRGVGVVL